MLKLALEAGIPIIRARTSDLLNLPSVLEYLAPGKTIMEAQGSSVPSRADIIYAVREYDMEQHTYSTLMEAGKTLILINQGEELGVAFDAGEVPVPRELMEDLLENVVSKKRIPELMPAFNGLTLKAMAEVIKLTTAKNKALTAKGINLLRAQLAGGVQGLNPVDTALPLYICPPALTDWVKRNKKYFIEAIDDRLMPRGILLDGAPGVGKSAGAKHIANELGVPLYRLDLGSSMSKWVGGSEQNLARVLATLDTAEPAVLLADEIEKIFTQQDDSGVTSRLLAQLLWWLAEHKSRVLVVMTTNDKGVLPKELYRAGRIDTTLHIERLTVSEGYKLAEMVLRQFIEKPTSKQLALLHKTVDGLRNPKAVPKEPQMSHAEVTQRVYDLVKDQGWK